MKQKELEQEIVETLIEKKYTITTAESCTGGMLAATIVNVPGASEVLREGYITYSNEAKERLVGVRTKTLESYGAVSDQTAKEMALGAAKVANSNVALSTTGIAGPDGGTAEKPVGLVYVGCCIEGKTTVREFRFKGNRKQNRDETVQEALKLLQEMLREE